MWWIDGLLFGVIGAFCIFLYWFDKKQNEHFKEKKELKKEQ